MGEETWEDWVQWKQRCALARCDSGTRRRLASFAQHRLRRAADRAAGMTNIPSGVWKRLPMAPDLAWHLFESHALLRHTREGKAYKEWLFARTTLARNSPAEVVAAGATLMLRDVARAYLSKECLRHGVVPLDAPVAGSDGQVTYRDLLPDDTTPAHLLLERELAEWATGEVDRLMIAWDHRERLVVAAKLRGVPLPHPDLVAATGWGRTKICQVCNRIFRSFLPRLQEVCPCSSDEALRSAAMLLLQKLEKRINLWISAECTHAHLFQVESTDEPSAQSERLVVT